MLIIGPRTDDSMTEINLPQPYVPLYTQHIAVVIILLLLLTCYLEVEQPPLKVR